jgi:hypothetical protein
MPRLRLFACLALLFAAALALPGLAQRAGPTTHMTVADPARLDDAEASRIYRAIRAAMAEYYAESGDPVAREYQLWTRLNDAPYRSGPHGARFVNNYANAVAAPAYGARGRAGAVPPGGLVAKDSFIVTARGQVMTGPLFLMEKRPKGFSPETGDWLFMAIGPDGRVTAS